MDDNDTESTELETTKAAKPMGRPLNPLTDAQLKLMGHLASIQCPHYEMARALGISAAAFSRRWQKDEQLREIVERNYADGKTSARRAMFQAMFDRYMTICKECEKISISFKEFSNTCTNPECGSKKVTHKFVNGDHTLMIFWSKNYLGMKDRMEMSGDQNSPMQMQMNVTTETPEERLARYKTYFKEMALTDDSGNVAVSVEKIEQISIAAPDPKELISETLPQR